MFRLRIPGLSVVGSRAVPDCTEARRYHLALYEFVFDAPEQVMQSGRPVAPRSLRAQPPGSVFKA